jgi:hypothetical protein
LYRFERRDEKGNLIPDDKEAGEEEENPASADNNNASDREERTKDGTYRATEGQSREKIKSPAQQLTDRAKDLRRRAIKRNARDARDAKKNVEYKLVLDPRLAAPRFDGGSVKAVKILTKKGVYVGAVVYQVPSDLVNDNTKTIIYSHGNATDVGAMFPLQCILAHSLECNVISYDYSGYGESGGTPMEANTYRDIAGVYEWTLKNICGDDASKIILYGQSVGSGPCCHLASKEDDLGGMILHSPFTSGMRVLTPSR